LSFLRAEITPQVYAYGMLLLPTVVSENCGDDVGSSAITCIPIFVRIRHLIQKT